MEDCNLSGVRLFSLKKSLNFYINLTFWICHEAILYPRQGQMRARLRCVRVSKQVCLLGNTPFSHLALFSLYTRELRFPGDSSLRHHLSTIPQHCQRMKTPTKSELCSRAHREVPWVRGLGFCVFRVKFLFSLAAPSWLPAPSRQVCMCSLLSFVSRQCKHSPCFQFIR